MFKKLLKIYQLRIALEKDVTIEKQKFEDSIALKKAQLSDLFEQESLLREQAFLELEKKNIDSIKEDDHTISRQIKRTRYIKDVNALQGSITYNIATILKLFDKIDQTELFESQMIIKDKDKVNEIIDKYEKVEGKLLEGVDVKETKFVIIK